MSEISTTSSGTSRYCACGTKIIRRTSWIDLNPGRRIAEEVYIISSGWIMKLVQEENKWSLVLLRRLRAMEEEGRAKEEQLRAVEAKKKELQQKLKEMVQEKKVLEWGHGQRQLIMWVSLILSWGLFITFLMSEKL
ncbi:unnamed protein product [Prunus armeniaca]